MLLFVCLEQILYLEGKKQHGDAEKSKPAPLDIQDIYKLTLFHLEREKELGAARSLVSSLLRDAESFLILREKMVSGSLPPNQKEGLETLALKALETHPIEIPPLSAFIKATLLPKQSSATCKRISSAFTILLLCSSHTPQTTTINTTPLSNEVLSANSYSLRWN